MEIQNFKILLLYIYCDGMLLRQEELGLAFIAAYLRNHGFPVEVRAYAVESFNCNIILQSKPNLIGAVVYDVNKVAVLDVFAQIRSTDNTAVLCVGGHCPTMSPASILQESINVDVAVVGEGEKTFAELAESLCKGLPLSRVKGIVFRTKNGLFHTDARPDLLDMREIPFPSRDLLDQFNSVVAQISTSRGCCAHCSFCITGQSRRRWIGRSPEEIADEIELLYRKRGIRAFNIIDCSFEDPGVNRQRLEKFSRQIIDRHLQISYYVQMRASSYSSLDDRLMHLLLSSGLSSVCLGLESGNNEDLTLYNKQTTVSEMKQAYAFFKAYDLNIDPGFINFNPYTSIETLKRNLEFLYERGLCANASYLLKPCRIYRNTSLYEKIQKDNLIDPTMPLGYTFAEKRVENLFEFLNTGLSNQRSLIKAVNHGASFDLVAYACLKTIFRNENNPILYSNICALEKEHFLICRDLNEQIYQWFFTLLSLAKTGWSDEKARSITNDLFSIKDLKIAVIRYAGSRNRTLKSLTSLSLSPEIQNLAEQLFTV